MMAPAIGLLQLLLLAAGCFAVSIALLTAVIYPRLRPHLGILPAALRAGILRWVCVAPSVAALVLTSLCLLPTVLGVIWPQLDHCLTHRGHVHLCFVHPPASVGTFHGWVLNGVFWGFVAAGLIAVARRTITAAISLRELRQAARYDPAVGAHLIASSLPFCAVVGLMRQKILLSTALAEALPQPLLSIVLAHERGHVRRRDSLWLFVASMLSVAHLPALRRDLLADLALASEVACDEDAAAAVGDRLGVASAILFVERLLSERSPISTRAPAFGGSDVPARVEALLEAPSPPRCIGRRTIPIALIAGIIALASSGALHHGTETLLGLLVD